MSKLSHPRSLSIMGTATCNARCIFCVYPLKARNPETLDMATFCKVVDQFAALGKPFDVGMTPAYADPLMDPLLFDRIDYLKSIPAVRYIHFNTNLIAAEKVGIEKLLTCGAHSIHVSIGGLDRPSYRRLFGVDAYPRVFSSLVELLSLNQDRGSVIGIDIIVRADEPIETVRSKADYAVLQQWIKPGRIQMNIENEYDDWGGQVSLGHLQKAKPLHVKKERACFLLHHTLNVQADRQFALCACKDLAGSELVFGDARVDPLSVALERRQRLILDWEQHGKIPDVCRRCNVYQDPQLRVEKLKDKVMRKGSEVMRMLRKSVGDLVP